VNDQTMGRSVVSHRGADRPEDRTNLEVGRVERKRRSRRNSHANAHRAPFDDDHATFGPDAVGESNEQRTHRGIDSTAGHVCVYVRGEGPAVDDYGDRSARWE
jgi:hypothetical protein